MCVNHVIYIKGNMDWQGQGNYEKNNTAVILGSHSHTLYTVDMIDIDRQLIRRFWWHKIA